MPSNAISQYLKNVEKDLAGGRATEHTYRPALKAVVESFAKGMTATNEPKRDSLAPLSGPNDEDAEFSVCHGCVRRARQPARS